VTKACPAGTWLLLFDAPARCCLPAEAVRSARFHRTFIAHDSEKGSEPLGSPRNIRAVHKAFRRFVDRSSGPLGTTGLRGFKSHTLRRIREFPQVGGFHGTRRRPVVRARGAFAAHGPGSHRPSPFTGQAARRSSPAAGSSPYASPLLPGFHVGTAPSLRRPDLVASVRVRAGTDDLCLVHGCVGRSEGRCPYAHPLVGDGPFDYMPGQRLDRTTRPTRSQPWESSSAHADSNHGRLA
jgi:hypothetical protein